MYNHNRKMNCAQLLEENNILHERLYNLGIILNDLHNKNEQNTRNIDKLILENQKLRTLYENSLLTISQLKIDNNKLFNKNNNLEHKLDNANNKIIKLESQNNSLENKLDNANKKIIILENKLDNANKKIIILENKLDNANKKIIKLESQNNSLENKLDNANKKIIILESQNNSLENKLDNANKKIIILESQNNNLENKLDNANKRIIILENDNKLLKEEVKLLKDDNTSLHSIIMNMNYITIKQHWYRAIQDLNNANQLEKIVDENIRKMLQEIKGERNGNSHYLDIKLSDDEILYRRFVLLQKMNNMPDKIKKLFDTKYPTLIEKIKPFVYQYNNMPKEINKDEVDAYWII